MNLDICWKIKFYEYFERNNQPMGDPIHEYSLVSKFTGEMCDDLTNGDKKQYLKIMLNKFYNDLCQEMELN